MSEKEKEVPKQFLLGLDATQLKYLLGILREKEGQLPETAIQEIALVNGIADALEESEKSFIRVKFGWNLNSQSYICARCRKEFDNTPDNFSLSLRLEILDKLKYAFEKKRGELSTFKGVQTIEPPSG